MPRSKIAERKLHLSADAQASPLPYGLRIIWPERAGFEFIRFLKVLFYIAVMFRIASRSSRRHLLQLSLPCLAERIGRYAPASVCNVDNYTRNYSSSAPTEQRLAGQVAIITGGASGLGARTARLFTQHGARVIIADIQDSKAEQLVNELGPQAEFVHCDVRKEEDIVKTWDYAYSLENKLDVVLNNAGILGALGPISELRIAEYDETMKVNLRAMVLGVKHSARLMIPAQKGSIVCMSSVAGASAGLFAFSYSLTKASIISMVKCAATELRRFGIRVNSIAPDLVATPMAVDLIEAMTGVGTGKFGVEKLSVISPTTPEADEGATSQLTVEGLSEMLKEQSLVQGRSITDTDVANAVLFLSADTGGYITGHNLAIDGGRANLKLVNPEMNAWATTYQPMYNVAGRRGL